MPLHEYGVVSSNVMQYAVNQVTVVTWLVMGIIYAVFVAHDELINLAQILVQIASLQADLYPVHMHHGILFGVVGNVLPTYEAGTLNFEMALEESITIGGMAVAIHGDGNNFSVFDSHARNSHGKCSANGLAVLLQFDNIKDLVKYFTDTYNKR